MTEPADIPSHAESASVPSGPTSPPVRSRTRRWALPVAAVGAAASLTLGLLVTTGDGATAQAATGAPAVQSRLDALVDQDGLPGALAAVRGRDSEVRSYTAGVAELGTEEPVPLDGQVRIGSNTKTFTATVVLQLVGEGKIELDAPIEDYLPGLVRGKGIDGRKITVRQLLNHTSGLPDYDEVFAPGYLPFQHQYMDPRSVLELALAKPAVFAPGASWAYSNANYILAGLLVQEVTGRPVGEEITNRVIEPLELEDTYWPTEGEQALRDEHPNGYYAAKPDEPWVDVTELDPSFGWAAGAMVSTPSDLLEFFTALIDGRLLSPALLAEMKETVTAPESGVRGDERYGLGLSTFTLSCGGVAWTHGGDIPGYETRNAVTEDGRGAAVAVTALPTSLEMATHVEEAVDAAICS